MQKLPKQAPTAEVLAYADQMREARHWADAAIGYRNVVECEPELAPIWVQLGHALKESGDQTQAEAAYRKAIHLAPNVAENHLQLGHLFKLSGRRQKAISAFREALRMDPEFRPAITELAALGVTWRADSNTDRESCRLHQTLHALHKIARSLANIEAELPSLASLATVPVDHYDTFRRKFSVSLPPEQSKRRDAAFSVIVVDVTVSRVSDILVHRLRRKVQVAW